MQQKKIKVAIVQAAPVYYKLYQSLSKAKKLVTEAVKRGAQLVAFGETWLPGYPAWLDMCTEAALWNHDETKELFATLKENSVVVPGIETAELAQLAKKLKIVIAIGVNERVEKGRGRGTLFNSLLLFNSNGELVNHHRKLIPTYTERLVWGQGDARGLKAATTTAGTVGGSICWEHWMPLTRQHLHNEAEQIHISMWPGVHEMHQVASRHYAFEGRCFVLACGLIMYKKDMPRGFKVAEKYARTKSDFLINGGSAIIGPDGSYIAGPVFDKETILVAEIDTRQIAKEQMTLDTAGHYYRDDVFNFSLKRT